MFILCVPCLAGTKLKLYSSFSSVELAPYHLNLYVASGYTAYIDAGKYWHRVKLDVLVHQVVTLRALIHVLSVTVACATSCRPITERSGGAILSSGRVYLTHCVLENNSAYTGPAVSNTFFVFMSWTEFDGNALLCNAGYFLGVNTSVSDCRKLFMTFRCLLEHIPQGMVVHMSFDVGLCSLACSSTFSVLPEGTNSWYLS